MNQKEYKLSISKNKTIIKEVGPGKYSGEQTRALLKKMGTDALKSVGSFLKRSWGATFGYAWKIYKNIKKHGVVAGLAAANKEFITADKQIKREMQSLIKAQPGAADADLFMSMACPAAKAFDLFVDKEFTKKNMMNLLSKGDPNQKDREKYKSLYNFIMAISHISNNTSLEKYEENNKKLSRSDRKKLKRKNYEISSESKKSLETEEFWKVCEILSKFNKILRLKSIREKVKELNLQLFTVTKEQMLFLNHFLKNRNIKSGLNYLKDNEVEYYINSLNNIILYDDSIECIKLILDSDIDISDLKAEKESEGEDENTQEHFNVLSIKSNRLVLKEDETGEDETGEDETKNKKESVDLKSAMSLSFSSFKILRSLILADLIKSSIKTPVILNEMTIALFKKLVDNNNLKEGFSNKINLLFEQDQKSIETESFEKIEEIIEKLNSRIEIFNNQFDFKIKKVDKSIVQKIKSGFLEIEKNVDNDLKKVQSELEKGKEKEIAIASGIQEILDSITKSLADIEISSTIEKSISDAVAIITEDISDIKGLSQSITSGSDKLSKLGIESTDISYITNSMDNNRSDFEKLKSLENKLKSYTSKKSELESKIEQDTEALDKENEKDKDEDSSTETIEVPADQLSNK